MTMTEKLKERFCKDLNLSIKIFEEPFFSERLELYDKQYHCKNKYENFVKLVESCGGEQGYFELYNKVKDSAITYLNNNPYMQFFAREEDFSKFQIKNKGFSKHDIYHADNNGKYFVSFDMIKGNFTALHHYDKRIVNNADTYEEFLGSFTNHSHLLYSKYIRQVIFGNVNPKRQVTYEQYLMDKVMDKLLKRFDNNKIVFFSTDEIVMKLDDAEIYSVDKIAKEIVKECKLENINIRSEVFKLHKIEGIDGYIKEFLEKEKGIDIKGVNSINMPFVLRALNGEEITENDTVFLYEGQLAKLLKPTKITIPKF